MSESKIKENIARKKSLQDKYQPGFNADGAFLKEDIKNFQDWSASAKKGTQKGVQPWPQGFFHHGNYIESDERDAWYEDYTAIVNGGEGANKFGSFSAPNDVVDYHRHKREQVDYLDELRVANFLVDPTDPSTVEKLYSLYPELKEVPNKWYNDMLALQMTLKNILFRGRVESREDIALIRHVCAPRFVLPMYPAWDPAGLILNSTSTMKELDSYFKNQNDLQKRALFNPFQWSTSQIEGFGTQTGDYTNWFQQDCKMMILRRLYPRFRDKEDEYIKSTFYSANTTDTDFGSGTSRANGITQFTAPHFQDNQGMRNVVKRAVPLLK